MLQHRLPEPPNTFNQQMADPDAELRDTRTTYQPEQGGAEAALTEYHSPKLGLCNQSYKLTTCFK